MPSITATTANRRLVDINRHISPSTPSQGTNANVGQLILVLPSGERVTTSPPSPKDGVVELQISGHPVCLYRPDLEPKLVYEISSVGTPFENKTTHIPGTGVVEVFPALGIRDDITIADFWVLCYVLFTRDREAEHIPLRLSPSKKISNEEDLAWYLLSTGLGRLPTNPKPPASHAGIIFLSRAAFWQGAGTTHFHTRGWLRNPKPSNFPSLPAFTRNDLVIAKHPLRPPKPRQGELLYKRWSGEHGEVLEFTAFDLGDSRSEVSPHLAAFHRWHNDERVNSAWGEQGSLEKHREYLEGLIKNPGVVPLMMSWNGNLMGYVEVVWIKENHVAQHYPEEVSVGDWDRGIHVLVGEEKYLGNGRSEVWLRSLAHYLFLEDPRLLGVVGEPKASNIAINKASAAAGYRLVTTIDFPYKRSSLVVNRREQFFNMCRLH